MNNAIVFNFDDTHSMRASDQYMIQNYLVYYHEPSFNVKSEMADLMGGLADKVEDEEYVE